MGHDELFARFPAKVGCRLGHRRSAGPAKAVDFLLAHHFLVRIGQLVFGLVQVLYRFLRMIQIAAVKQTQHQVDLFGVFVTAVAGQKFLIGIR